MFRFKGIAWSAGIGIFALAASPALAISPQHAGPSPSLIVPVMDEEDAEVERDLETDQAPKTKSGRDMVPAPDRADSDGGNVEQEELKRDLETAE